MHDTRPERMGSMKVRRQYPDLQTNLAWTENENAAEISIMRTLALRPPLCQAQPKHVSAETFFDQKSFSSQGHDHSRRARTAVTRTREDQVGSSAMHTNSFKSKAS